jgi:DNA-binding transcriptional ArsR family regulator
MNMNGSDKMNHEKDIKIGIIGPGEMIELVVKTMKSFPSFAPLFRMYSNERDAPIFAQELLEQVEVLLFTGIIPYKLAADQLKFHIPVHYIPLTSSGLYRSLFHIQKQVGLFSLSVDTISLQEVHKTLKELGQDHTQTIYYNQKVNPTNAELIQFHTEQYEKGLCTAVLTGLKSVSIELAKRNIPNEWLVPTEQDITVSLERALLSTETRRSKESQIVAGIINVDGFEKLSEKKTSEHDIQRLKLDIHRMLLGYVESLDGYLTPLGGDEYLFITTRGIFERMTGGYKSIPLDEDMEKTYGVSLSIGIGFGRSANEAGTHARAALRNAKDGGGNLCFIVREDRSVMGPLRISKPNEFELSLIDVGLIQEVEQAGMSSKYFSKLAATITRTGQTDFIANELSIILNVTTRTVHRLLLSLMDAGLVEIVGEERGPFKGRPNQIYRLSFLTKLVR